MNTQEENGRNASCVDDVLITEELTRRRCRMPDYAAETRALADLAREMADSPGGVLQKVAELAMALCRADSAGISILEDEGENGIFRWHAAAGAFSANLQGTMPRDASPCGIVIERDSVLLFSEASRFFPAMRDLEPRIYENLLAPWHVDGRAVGTLWAIGHTPEHRFDAEDARVLESLSRFASAAYQMTHALHEAHHARAALERRVEEIKAELARDAAERERAEDALRRTEERLQAALTATGVATWGWDAETGRVVASATMADLFGLLPDERFETSAQGLRLVHPDDRERLESIVRSAARSGGSWHTEYRIVRPRDGRLAWLEERASATRDPGTGQLTVTGVIWDITERKRAEEALRRAQEELEARVSERTRELTVANRSLREEITQRQHAEEARLQLLRQLLNVQETERRRISRELHDQLGQQVSALSLKLSMLKDNAELRPGLRRELEQLEQLARQTDGEVDFLVWQLRPTVLDDLGLVDALWDYVESWSRHYGIPVEFDCDRQEGERLSIELETVLYRVAQEALNNVAKHAHARRVEVTIQRDSGEIVLMVRDDGVGFDAAAQAAGGRTLGLLGMRERAALGGGSLLIDSKPGAGTTVTVHLPAAVLDG